MRESNQRALLRRATSVFAAGTAAVVICYLWIDRPVAFFVEREHINQYEAFRWLTYPPPLVQTWSPLVLAILAVRWAWRPLARWELVLSAACLSLIVADEFRTS